MLRTKFSSLRFLFGLGPVLVHSRQAFRHHGGDVSSCFLRLPFNVGFQVSVLAWSYTVSLFLCGFPKMRMRPKSAPSPPPRLWSCFRPPDRISLPLPLFLLLLARATLSWLRLSCCPFPFAFFLFFCSVAMTTVTNHSMCLSFPFLHLLTNVLGPAYYPGFFLSPNYLGLEGVAILLFIAMFS